MYEIDSRRIADQPNADAGGTISAVGLPSTVSATDARLPAIERLRITDADASFGEAAELADELRALPRRSRAESARATPLATRTGESIRAVPFGGRTARAASLAQGGAEGGSRVATMVPA